MMTDIIRDESRIGSVTITRTVVLLAALLIFSSNALASTAMGPLRVSTDNPRYFATPDGTAVYLAGSHTWNNLVDMDAVQPPRRFDYDAYLRFLDVHHLNFFRLWSWELPAAQSKRYVRRQYADPQPWLRTGPGKDVMGLPRFDFRQFNKAYFDRLRDRVAAAQEHGIYVSIMLFEGWGAQFEPGKASHPFNRQNNINSIGYRDDPRDIYTLKYPQITSIQEEYARHVIDTVNRFDNVIYEIVNEAGIYSTKWQQHMIDLVRSYEDTKPKQHPIGMTAQYPDGDNATLFASTADWISPNAGKEDAYLLDPGPADGRKVVIVDTDHIGGSSTGSRDWVWRSFLRGMNLLFMDLYTAPDSVSDSSYRYDYDVRTAMGDTRLIAGLLRLQDLVPRPDLSSTRYVLSGDQSAVVYQPESNPLWVDLSHLPGSLSVEWFDTVTGSVKKDRSVTGGTKIDFKPPFDHPSVLMLHSTSIQKRSLVNIVPDARKLRDDAIDYLHWSSALKQRLRNWLADQSASINQ